MRDLARLTGVLMLISLVSALALSQAFELTKERIAYERRQEVLRAIRAVLPPFDNEPDQDTVEVVIGKDRRGREKKVVFYQGRREGKLVGRAFVITTHEGYGGDIDVMMGVTPEGVITGVEILRHLETPGLGDKIVKDRAWRESFKGKSLANDIRVKKDGGEIDQFAGATISPRAVCQAVRMGLELHQKEFAS